MWHTNHLIRQSATYLSRLYYRYLGSWSKFDTLGLEFTRGASTIGLKVKECKIKNYNMFHSSHTPLQKEEDPIRTAKRFEYLWDLPNCIEALDGKHIKIQKFNYTSSLNFNYRFSIPLYCLWALMQIVCLHWLILIVKMMVFSERVLSNG